MIVVLGCPTSACRVPVAQLFRARDASNLPWAWPCPNCPLRHWLSGLMNSVVSKLEVL